MTEPITKPRVSAAAKTALVLAAAAVLLAVFALAAPGSKFFFPLVSLWCNLALFACVLLVLRVAVVKFDLFHKAIIVGLWAAALVYFFWALGRRSFVYIWDYFNYISKQYSAEAAFLQSPAAGFQFIFGSFAEDYTNFITLFLEFPFCLSDRTGDSFAFCQVFSILPMLLVLLAGLTIKVGQMLPGEKPLLVLPHRHDLDGHLPVAAHERHAQPAGLVRPHLRLQHSAAHAGLPV